MVLKCGSDVFVHHTECVNTGTLSFHVFEATSPFLSSVLHFASWPSSNRSTSGMPSGAGCVAGWLQQGVTPRHSRRMCFYQWCLCLMAFFSQWLNTELYYSTVGITDNLPIPSPSIAHLNTASIYFHGSASCCNACSSRNVFRNIYKHFFFSNHLLFLGTIWGSNCGWNAETISVPTVRWRGHTLGLPQSPWE
jgi:hypothetical protein